jgi:hypothetical protein
MTPIIVRARESSGLCYELQLGASLWRRKIAPTALLGRDTGLSAATDTQDADHSGGNGEYEEQAAEEFHRVRVLCCGANWSRTNDLILIRDAL